MKRCSKKNVCNGELKPLSEFHKDKNRPDGHKDICKECIKEYGSLMNYWKKSDLENYQKFNFSRRKYFLKKYPHLNYTSFTSHIKRNCDFYLGDLTREEIDTVVIDWLNKKGTND